MSRVRIANQCRQFAPLILHFVATPGQAFAHKWFFVEGGDTVANAAGSIAQVHGEGVSSADYGLEEVAGQKLAG